MARSKNRGLGGFLGGRGGLVLGSNSCLCRVLRTVSGLAGKSITRRNQWAIRRTPKPGCCCLIATICCLTTGGSLGFAGARVSPQFRSNPARPIFL